MLKIVMIMLCGIGTGYLLRNKKMSFIGRVITALIWVLLFLLGIEVGANPRIINGLQTALDKRGNPELFDRMYALYDYMKELLAKASVSLDVSQIDEVINLILPIKQAWDQIPQDIKDKTNQEILNSPDY